jgi:hypothetical protein
MSLNARELRLDEEEKVAAANKPPPLNPPFPYSVVEIDLEDMGLLEEPPVDKSKKT